MILIGQYDSPFVRRVGIALTIYGMAFEHRPWSTVADAESIASYNPLRRVPTLVLDDGEVLIESGAILDHLDQVAGHDAALIARAGPLRRQALKVCALSTGLSDKAVSLFYEKALHEKTSAAWVKRCGTQIHAALAALEADRARHPTPFWFGDAIGHADIAVACALRFLSEAHAELFEPGAWPRCVDHAKRCENLPAFTTIVQPFRPPY